MIFLSFAGVDFTLFSDSTEVEERTRTIFPAAGTEPQWPSRMAVQIRIECQGGRYPHDYRLYLDGKLREEGLTSGEALALVEHLVIREIVMRTQSHLVFHGATVSRNSESSGPEAIALIGAGGSGKTALCCEMIRQGWNYLSDELALVRLKTYYVEPFHRAILVKPKDSFAGIPSEPLRPTIDDGRCYIHWNSIRRLTTGQESRLGGIVLCDHKNGFHTSPRMRFVRPAEALHTLVEACFNFHFIGKERAWKTITELIEKTPVASLEFSDPNSGADACGQILHSV